MEDEAKWGEESYPKIGPKQTWGINRPSALVLWKSVSDKKQALGGDAKATRKVKERFGG